MQRWPLVLLPFWVLAAGCGERLEATPVTRTQGAPRPPLRLVLTGYLDGRLEPCGCASAQAGGVDRRAWWFKVNAHRYDLQLEAGNLIHEDNPLERFKLIWIQTILGSMNYRVFPLGPNDLAMGSKALADFHDETGDPFLVTDLRRVEGDKENAPYLTYSIQQAGPHKVCLLSLAGPQGKRAGEGYRVLSPVDAVAQAQAKAGKRGRDYDLCLVFVNYGPADTARRLAKTLPGVDVIAGFERRFETKEAPEVFERDPARDGVARTCVLFPGWRGKNLLLWEGRKDASGSWVTVATKREVLQMPPQVPKGKRPPGSDPEVWNMLIESKRQIGADDILERMAERRPSRNGSRYVGSKACESCHESAWAVLQDSLHGHAWESLVRREADDGWPVTRHPDCVSCHVVGYGEKTGFVSVEKTPHLANVGCEACHGAGSNHVAAWKGVQRLRDAGQPVSAEALQAARKKGLLGKMPQGRCFECHDFEQSPGFDFQDRWEQIEHGLDGR